MNYEVINYGGLVAKIKGIQNDCILKGWVDINSFEDGLLKVVCMYSEMHAFEVMEKIVNIIGTCDVSDLEFANIDLSNDIKTIEEFTSVLFSNGVVWRRYINSTDECAGVVFGSGKTFSYFVGDGFYISSQLHDVIELDSFFNNIYGTLKEQNVPNTIKIDLLKVYIETKEHSEIINNKQEIYRFIEWFVNQHL